MAITLTSKTSYALILSAALILSSQALAAPQGFGQDTEQDHTQHLDPRGFPQHGVQRAAPQGFGLETSKPNSIKGVKTRAKDGDFVVLEGTFTLVQQGSDKIYFLKDAKGDSIEVDISSSNNAAEPVSDVPYFLWGQVKTSWFDTFISAIEYTPML